MMSASSPPSTGISILAAAAQIVLSLLAAAGIALALTPDTSAVLALLAGLAVGMLIDAPLLRSLWLAQDVLARLSQGQHTAGIPPRWHGPLAEIVASVNVLAGRDREVYDLRRGLLQQTRDAGAQAERNRLARELHDSIKQQIFSISMSAAAAQARAESDPEGARVALGDVRRSAQEAMVEMNALLQQLSPAPLEKVGLVQALRDQCQALGYRTGAEVQVEIGSLPDDDRLPPGAQDSLFRIVQEALSNIAQHARAGRVHLALAHDGGEGPVMLDIRDDGQGFDTGAANGGMGLTNIRQRVAALHGQLSVESRPGEGTALRIRIPLILPVITQEDTMELKANHTLNRTFLAALGGGLAMTAALFYPLYVDFPARYIATWPHDPSRSLSLALVGLATLLVAATGYIAARWGGVGRRAAGTLIGALAGFVAATVPYVLLGAPAAGLAGSRALLAHGLRPALDDPHALWLTAEPVVGAVYWTYAAMWAFQIAGVALGAIGGTFAPAARSDAPTPELRHAAANVAGLFVIINATALAVAHAVFRGLEPLMSGRYSSTGELIPQAMLPHQLSLPPEGVYLIPVGSALAIFAASLAALLAIRARQRQAGDPVELRGSFTVPLFYTLLTVLLGVALWPSTDPRSASTFLAGNTLTLNWITLLTTLAFAGLLAAETIREFRRRTPGAAWLAGWNPIMAIMALLLLAGVVQGIAWYAFLYLPTALCVIIPLAAAAWFVIRLYRRRGEVRLAERGYVERGWQGSLNMFGVGIPAALLFMSQVIPAALAMVLITIPAVVVVFAYDQTPLSPEAQQMAERSLVSIANDLYLVHIQSLGMVLLIVFVAEGLVLLGLRIVQAFMRRVEAFGANTPRPDAAVE